MQKETEKLELLTAVELLKVQGGAGAEEKVWDKLKQFVLELLTN